MRNIFYFAFLLLCIIVSSCSDNDTSIESEIHDINDKPKTSLPDISAQQRSVTDCGVIPEHCPKNFGPYEPDFPGPGNGTTVIVIQDDETDYQIEALDHISTSRQFSVRTEEAIYIISDNDETWIRKQNDESIEIPNSIFKVFELDYEKFLKNEISQEELEVEFGSENVGLEEGSNRFIVDGSASTMNDDGPTAALRKYDACKWRKIATVSAWKKNMFSGVDLSHPLYGIIHNTVTDAVDACGSDEEPCVECIDSRCILDALENTPGISEFLIDEMKLNYLVLLLDLDEDGKQFLEDNPIYLDDLLGTYGLKSIIGCNLAFCGSEGAAQAHLLLLMSGYQVDAEQKLMLCEFFTDLYAANENAYKCEVGNNCLGQLEVLINNEYCYPIELDEFSCTVYDNVGCTIPDGENGFVDWDDSNIFMTVEPKWGQLATCNDIKNEIISSSPTGTLLEQAETLALHFKGDIFYDRTDPPPNCSQGYLFIDANRSKLVKRYVYTQGKGWLDMHHFFAIYSWAVNAYENSDDEQTSLLTAGLAAATLGWTAESWQWIKGNYSGFAYEDICTNNMGAMAFIVTYEDMKAGDLTWDQLIDQLCDFHIAVDPAQAPNYYYIPHIIDDDYPKVYSSLDNNSCLKGEALRKAYEAEFKRLCKTDQLKRKEAHYNFPH